MYQSNRLIIYACLFAAGAGAIAAEPQWRAHRLPEGLADAPLDKRVEYMRRHLVDPANAVAQTELKSAAEHQPSQAQLRRMMQRPPAAIRPDRLVIETFVSSAMTDDVVRALCDLDGLDSNVDVKVEHRNYVVLEPDTTQPRVTVSTQCLDNWHATTDYGGEITRQRGVSSLPYFAAHYGSTTVQGDLSSYQHKIEQLAMQYGL